MNINPFWSPLWLHTDPCVWGEITSDEREPDYKSGKVAKKVQWNSGESFRWGVWTVSSKPKGYWHDKHVPLADSVVYFCWRWWSWKRISFSRVLKGINPPPHWLSVEAMQFISMRPVKIPTEGNLLRNENSLFKKSRRKRWWEACLLENNVLKGFSPPNVCTRESWINKYLIVLVICSFCTRGVRRWPWRRLWINLWVLRDFSSL